MKPRHGALCGYKATAEYRAWKGMRARCMNERNVSYKHYGAKGVRVCQEWLGPGGFERFLAHVGLRPSPNHSIDRYPNGHGNYEPGNVRWATIEQQNRNKGDTRMFTINGKTQCAAEWARDYGIRYDTLHMRLRRGWTIEQALQTQPMECNERLVPRKLTESEVAVLGAASEQPMRATHRLRGRVVSRLVQWGLLRECTGPEYAITELGRQVLDGKVQVRIANGQIQVTA